MKSVLKYSVLLLLIASQASHANIFWDDDNTAKPAKLVEFKPEIPLQKVWDIQSGQGSKGQYLKMAPTQFADTFYVADHKGMLSAIDQKTGKTRWTVTTKYSFSTTPATNGDVIAVGTDNASVAVFSAQNGKFLWTASLSNEVLAQPTVGQQRIFVKTIDDQLTALDSKTGKVQWHYDNGAPTLALRVSSAAKLAGNKLIVGFSDGKLLALNAENGAVLWKSVVAEPHGSSAVEQMVDISADPIISGHTVYATSYQGNLAAFRLENGAQLWKHELSSFTGMTLAHDTIYVSDAAGDVWAFQAKDGVALWRQQQLAARGLSAPAVAGPCVMVGDAEGYLHVLSTSDGHIRARTRVSKQAIVSEPYVAGRSVYVLATEGALSRYDLG